MPDGALAIGGRDNGSTTVLHLTTFYATPHYNSFRSCRLKRLLCSFGAVILLQTVSVSKQEYS